MWLFNIYSQGIINIVEWCCCLWWAKYEHLTYPISIECYLIIECQSPKVFDSLIWHYRVNFDMMKISMSMKALKCNQNKIIYFLPIKYVETIYGL